MDSKGCPRISTQHLVLRHCSCVTASLGNLIDYFQLRETPAAPENTIKPKVEKNKNKEALLLAQVRLVLLTLHFSNGSEIVFILHRLQFA